MASITHKRARLMLGCGGAALALSLAITAESAQAQAFQANESIVSGTAIRTPTGTGTETITVDTPTVVIDWTPFEDAAGNALDFLPTGAVANFENNGSDNPGANFAVLNRILPSSLNSVVVMDGSVISRIVDLQNGTSVAGGTIAFYSPTGIFVGNNAAFDVGSLILTALDPDPASFDAFFASGGTLNLFGSDLTNQSIVISDGATITASPENSFVAMVAPRVEMFGTATVNGSHAYVAGNSVDLTLTNGLFDIVVNFGTIDPNPITIGGNVGGPSSTGAGDNHMIYAVAHALFDPMSMIFSGNLGFDPAANASIVNGEIILSANYNVFGRTVEGGSISDGINASFDETDPFAFPLGQGDIAVFDMAATSSLLAIASDNVLIGANETDISVEGNLLAVGRTSAEVSADFATLDVTGDVLVSSRAFGAVGASFQGPSAISATGGNARLLSANSGIITIGGDVFVTADATAGADIGSLIAGGATGGTARAGADGGTLTIGGSTTVSADALSAPASDLLDIDSLQRGAQGGIAELFATNDGIVTIGQDLVITANAFGSAMDPTQQSTPSPARGGQALFSLVGGGTIDVAGDAFLAASATVQPSGSTNPGTDADADGGEALVTVDGAVTATIGGDLRLSTLAIAGDKLAGAVNAGSAVGGVSLARTSGGGNLLVGGDFDANASASGGSGGGGGFAAGGVAGAIVDSGSIDIAGSAFANAAAIGGDADFGFGGTGGAAQGGAALFQAIGSSDEGASLTIGLDVQMSADATGGRGGDGDGSDFEPQAGGDATGGDADAINLASSLFFNGVSLVADGDYGALSVGGSSFLTAVGSGGDGGSGSVGQNGGAGGSGTGGTIDVGLELFTGSGLNAAGTMSLGDVIANASGVGGAGGFGDTGGNGGDGFGGILDLFVSAGTLGAGQVALSSIGEGGDGETGGAGTGGSATAFGSLDGTLTLAGFDATASGTGGSGFIAGDGFGGGALMNFAGITATINGDVSVDATGFGGGSFAAEGGTGTGGGAGLVVSDTSGGTGIVTGNASVAANGVGGASGEGASGGDGFGGDAFLFVESGGTITLGSAQVTASGVGASDSIGGAHGGGNGTGGLAFIDSVGAGSRITIQNNTPADFADGFNSGAILAANGIGGDATGGSGIAGAGTGGEAEVTARTGGVIELPANPAPGTGIDGLIGILARGAGGGSTVDGETAGDGIGGTVTFLANAGTISAGAMTYSVAGLGGNANDTGLDISGGEGTGGSGLIQIVNGGGITGNFADGTSGGVGGSGSGNGTGGNAQGGTTLVSVTDGTLNLVGRSVFVDGTTGGDGSVGGNAVGGTVDFEVDTGTVTFTANAAGEAQAVVGGQAVGGGGVDQGGDASGPFTTVQIRGSSVTGGSFKIAADAQGGSATGTGGIGGDATAGEALLVANPSTIDLVGATFVSANAVGGAGDTGGSGTAGFASIDLLDTDLSVGADAQGIATIEISAFGEGGDGSVQAGDGEGGFAQILLNNSSLSADSVELLASADAAAIATGAAGGNASGGLIEAIIENNSSLSLADFGLDASASTSAGGSASGGEALLRVGSPSGGEQVSATNLALRADGSGGDDNFAGRFEVAVSSGLVQATGFLGTARGDAGGDFTPSQVSAIGGDFLVSDAFTVDVFDDFVVEAGQGSLIGGPDVLDPSVAIDITSQGTIRFLGDDDNAIDFGGLSMRLASRDIVIADGARIGAVTMDLTSLDTLNPAILGGEGTPDGSVTGEGYTLIAEELGRLDVGSFTFTQPDLPDAGTNDPDIIIREATAFGSADPDGGVSDIFVQTNGPGGIIRVEGLLSVVNASSTDTFTLFAPERIEVVTPGGITLSDSDNLPTGNLVISAANIWVADADLIGQLQSDRSFSGRNDLLAVAASGSDDPLGYLKAGRADFVVGESLLVRNTGSETEQGGVLVGEGGLFIRANEGSTQSPLDVFAYGRSRLSDGSFVTGSDFFSDVDFALNADTSYTDESEFNDCIINTGQCPGTTPPPVEPPPFEEDLSEIVAKINNPTTLTDPVDLPPDQIPLTEQESNEIFGPDFPGLAEAPLLSEDPLLDDPVASGGDSSAYGAGASEGGDDE